jgi:hypothetical protein
MTILVRKVKAAEEPSFTAGKRSDHDRISPRSWLMVMQLQLAHPIQYR